MYETGQSEMALYYALFYFIYQYNILVVMKK